jgi:septum formation protein
VIDTRTGGRASAVSSTIVHYGHPTPAEIDAYLATDEPLRVAGGFTIDGYAAPFVDRIEGDHGTVLGLSMPLLRRLLSEVGTPIVDLWDTP